jgi:hypothetical protein
MDTARVAGHTNVVLGQAFRSKLIKIQSTQHLANMTPNQLTLVEQWINAVRWKIKR